MPDWATTFDPPCITSLQITSLSSGDTTGTSISEQEAANTNSCAASIRDWHGFITLEHIEGRHQRKT